MKHAREKFMMRMTCIWAVLTAVACMGSAAMDDQPPESKLPVEEIVIKGEPFKLEVAANDDARATGLMNRAKIPQDQGMLFAFPNEEVRSFWMKNCLVDIDIAFVDERGRIVATHKMKTEKPRGESESEAQYEDRLKRYSSRKPAQFAIELKDGSIDRLELKVGQTIEADWPRLKKLAK